MNTLLLLLDGDQVHQFLIPTELIQELDLEGMNGKFLNLESHEPDPETTKEDIMTLFKRTGIEESDWKMDLEQFKDPDFPCEFEQVIVTGWYP